MTNEIPVNCAMCGDEFMSPPNKPEQTDVNCVETSEDYWCSYHCISGGGFRG